MRPIDVIRGPSRPTQVQLRHRRRRAAALGGLAGAALLLGAIVGAQAGGGSPAAGAATSLGFYGRVQLLAGAGTHSLAAAEQAQQNAAIDRALRRTPFVRMAGAQHRLVALTFDDGPSPYTDALVDELARLHVPATFFVVGYQLPAFAPQLQHEVAAGMTVGDHTLDHPNLAQLSPADQRQQIVGDAGKIAASGAPVPRLFRPPYGSYDETTHVLLARRRMLSVLWSVDSEDYTKPGVDAIVRNVVSAVQPGYIVLMHDGGGDRSETVAAVPRIVARLRRAGYAFVSVPRLLLESPPPDNQQLPSGFNPAGAG